MIIPIGVKPAASYECITKDDFFSNNTWEPIQGILWEKAVPNKW